MPSLSTSSFVKGRSSGQSRVRGFTMIEVLVALVILSFGFQGPLNTTNVDTTLKVSA